MFIELAILYVAIKYESHIFVDFSALGSGFRIIFSYFYSDTVKSRERRASDVRAASGSVAAAVAAADNSRESSAGSAKLAPSGQM